MKISHVNELLKGTANEVETIFVISRTIARFITSKTELTYMTTKYKIVLRIQFLTTFVILEKLSLEKQIEYKYRLIDTEVGLYMRTYNFDVVTFFFPLVSLTVDPLIIILNFKGCLKRHVQYLHYLLGFGMSKKNL